MVALGFAIAIPSQVEKIAIAWPNRPIRNVKRHFRQGEIYPYMMENHVRDG